LEDYLERSAAPARQLPRAIERRMSEIGRGLFRAVFEANRERFDCGNDVGDRLGAIRGSEISTGVREANAMPWELLRDPRTGRRPWRSRLRIRACFNRRQHANRVFRKIQSGGPVRVLLVICRPAGAMMFHFESVANQFGKGADGCR